jgi:hypothetical protein
MQRLFSLFLALALSISANSTALCADELGKLKIRQVSSRKSERLFNQIVIDLMNGKSRYASIDKMVDILKDYQIVDFCTNEQDSIQEIVIKEVAFRMLKQNYVPMCGDKIKIYKLQQSALTDAGIDCLNTRGREVLVGLSLSEGDNQLRAINWSNLVIGVSVAIENLRLRRMRYTTAPLDNNDEKQILQAVAILRSKYIDDKSEIGISSVYSVSLLVGIIEEKINSWAKGAEVLAEDADTLAALFIQYLILSNPSSVLDIADEIKGIRNIEDLKTALIIKIKNITDFIKNNKPVDYGALAMLQGLLNEIGRLTPISIKPLSPNSPQQISYESA